MSFGLWWGSSCVCVLKLHSPIRLLLILLLIFELCLCTVGISSVHIQIDVRSTFTGLHTCYLLHFELLLSCSCQLYLYPCH